MKAKRPPEGDQLSFKEKEEDERDMIPEYITDLEISRHDIIENVKLEGDYPMMDEESSSGYELDSGGSEDEEEICYDEMEIRHEDDGGEIIPGTINFTMTSQVKDEYQRIRHWDESSDSETERAAEKRRNKTRQEREDQSRGFEQ